MNVVEQNSHNTINLRIYSVSMHYKPLIMSNDHLLLDENELYVDQLVLLFPIDHFTKINKSLLLLNNLLQNDRKHFEQTTLKQLSMLLQHNLIVLT